MGLGETSLDEVDGVDEGVVSSHLDIEAYPTHSLLWCHTSIMYAEVPMVSFWPIPHFPTGFPAYTEEPSETSESQRRCP